MLAKINKQKRVSYPPNILPPELGVWAFVVEMLAAANKLVSPPPNKDPPLCTVVAGCPNIDACVVGVGEPNTDAWVACVGVPNIDA